MGRKRRRGRRRSRSGLNGLVTSTENRSLDFIGLFIAVGIVFDGVVLGRDRGRRLERLVGRRDLKGKRLESCINVSSGINRWGVTSECTGGCL